MIKGRQKMKMQQILIKNHHKMDGKFSRQRLDSESDPDPVCPERSDPDPVNIRPDPRPCLIVIDLT